MTNRSITIPDSISLDRFFSRHAHDLRTPYNHITGFSKMLINTIGEAPLDDSQKEDLATIYRSGMRALSMINDLIDIARTNRGEKEVVFGEVDLPSLLERSITQWKKFHPGYSTQVEVRSLTRSGTIGADEILAQHLIANSISYVGSFCESKTKVTITVEDEPTAFLFTFSSDGVKTRMLSELDLEILGVSNLNIIKMHDGQIRRVEESDTGGLFQFSLPMQ